MMHSFVRMMVCRSSCLGLTYRKDMDALRSATPAWPLLCLARASVVRNAAVALAEMDRWRRRRQGCTIPGCTAPLFWADADYVIHWVDGGQTSLLNAALLCGRPPYGRPPARPDRDRHDRVSHP